MSRLLFQVFAVVSFASAGFSQNATNVTGEQIPFHLKWRFSSISRKTFLKRLL